MKGLVGITGVETRGGHLIFYLYSLWEVFVLDRMIGQTDLISRIVYFFFFANCNLTVTEV